MGQNDKVGHDDEQDKWCWWKTTTWMKDTCQPLLPNSHLTYWNREL